MKKIIALLCLLPALALADEYDLLIMQRNSTDTGNVSRVLPKPAGGVAGFVIYDPNTLQPGLVTLGSGC